MAACEHLQSVGYCNACHEDLVSRYNTRGDHINELESMIHKVRDLLKIGIQAHYNTTHPREAMEEALEEIAKVMP